MITDLIGLPLDPDLFATPWPDSLPASVRYGSFADLDDHALVIPWWNSAPRRDVIRAGCVVAIIDTTDFDQVILRGYVELPTEGAARVQFAEAYARACADARVTFAHLPNEEKRGALVPPGVAGWIPDDEEWDDFEWEPDYR
jgi:hypothetical protein